MHPHPYPRRSKTLRDETYELLQEDRQFCSLFRKYSPEYVRDRALASPKDAFETGLRLATIVLRLGTFAAGLALDNLTGAGDTPERCGGQSVSLHHMRCAGNAHTLHCDVVAD